MLAQMFCCISQCTRSKGGGCCSTTSREREGLQRRPGTMLTEMMPKTAHSEVSAAGFRNTATLLFHRHALSLAPCQHCHVHSCPYHRQSPRTVDRTFNIDKHWVPAGDRPLTKGLWHRFLPYPCMSSVKQHGTLYDRQSQ